MSERSRTQGSRSILHGTPASPRSDYAGWWLDPQSSDFGENAKYFKHNIAEAKKLLSAAGYPDGITSIANRRQAPTTA